ncbi:MAG: response regulator [Anaerolineae bacterium]|nr:response regulator [Anaerolineae bacterium]
MADEVRVLIVDDEEGMRDFLAFVLKTEGYQPLTAAGGREALELLQRNNVDAILADLKMPGMDGLELLRRIREYDENAVVIIMTAYASLQTALEAMKYGAYDYLLKPFDNVDTVMNAVARAVERRKLSRRNARLLADLDRANEQLARMYESAQRQAVSLRQAYDELKKQAELQNRQMSRLLNALLDSLAQIKERLALLTDESQGPLSDEQREALRRTEHQAGEIVRVVDDMLYLQQAEARQAQFNPRPLSLAALVTQVCQQLQSKADERAITWDCSLPADLPPVLADEVHLRRAITHLLDNALKFSPPSGVVSVSLQQEGTQMRLNVRDQGRGIPEEKLKHVFDYWHRSDSTQRQEVGWGLGLGVVKRVVDAHGGAIEINSQEGKGTTVTLILPNVVEEHLTA